MTVTLSASGTTTTVMDTSSREGGDNHRGIIQNPGTLRYFEPRFSGKVRNNWHRTQFLKDLGVSLSLLREVIEESSISGAGESTLRLRHNEKYF